MKLLRKLWKRYFGAPKGTPCEVQGKEAGTVAIVPGMMTVNIGKAVQIEYKWIDNTMHSFGSNQDNYVKQRSGIPLFIHDVGSLYAEKVGKADPIGSEDIYNIVSSNVIGQCAEYLEELREEEPSPMKRIIKIAIIVVAVFLIWKTGFVQSVISDIIPAQAPPAPSAPVPPTITPPLEIK